MSKMSANKSPRLVIVSLALCLAFEIVPAQAVTGVCGTTITQPQIDSIYATLENYRSLDSELVKYQAQGSMYPSDGFLERYRASRAEFAARWNKFQEDVASCRTSLTTNFAQLEEYGNKIAELLKRKKEETHDDGTDPIITLLDSLWHWNSPSVNDPLAKEQHHIRMLGFSENLSENGNKPIVVAVIDDGVLIDHEDLKEAIWVNDDEIAGNWTDDDQNGFVDDTNGWDFVSNTRDMNPWGSHGTGVASLIASKTNNALGIAGVGGNVRIMPIIACNGTGDCATENIERAIEYAVFNGARVINLSLGKENLSLFTPDINRALQKTALFDVAVVAAAGNGDENGRGLDTSAFQVSPACNGFSAYDVIAVAATNSGNDILPWSNYGGCVDVRAPGFNTALASVPKYTGKLYRYGTGTSFAAPLITGMIARILQIDTSIKPREVRELLLSHARLDVPYFADIAAAMRGAAPAPSNTQSQMPISSQSYDRETQRNAATSINIDRTIGAVSAALCESGALIKSQSSRAVYYCGADGKRYVFPNQQTYLSWYPDFNGVTVLADEVLAQIAIGGVVTYRPGTRMLKIQTSPTVYAVAANGELRAIGSEAVARRLYGNEWNTLIDDISDAFFINYRVGSPINE